MEGWTNIETVAHQIELYKVNYAVSGLSRVPTTLRIARTVRPAPDLIVLLNYYL